MTDLPFKTSQTVDSAGVVSAVRARLTALIGTAGDALSRTILAHKARTAQRRAPEQILAAQARREEARRAVDRLLQRR